MNKSSIGIHLILFISLFLLGLFFLKGNAHAQNSNTEKEVYSKVRVLLDEEKSKSVLLELGLCVDHAHSHNEGSLDFFVNQEEFEILNEANFLYSILIPNFELYYEEMSKKDLEQVSLSNKAPSTADNFGYGSMGGFYTLAEMEAKLDSMSILFPAIATAKFSIGTSIEDREIWAVKISDNPTLDEEEPAVYYDALHHSREPLSMAVSINYMFWLLENYASNPLVKYMVDNREMFFVPCVNPDGYAYNQVTNPNGGGLWRKNRRLVNNGCYGVDLNRNYGHEFGFSSSCASSDPCSNIYKGTNAFSEPETIATSTFIEEIDPGIAFSIHSTAGSYLMPYGFDMAPPAFNIYSEWASDFLSENDYPYGVTYEMLGYTSCGTTRDYLHSEGIYAWTPEIDGSGFWPFQSEIFDLVDENVYPLFYQAWIAGAYADFQSHNITGDAFPGSSFLLNVEVKNKGIGSDANNVVVNVSSPSSDVSIEGDGTIGFIEARGRKTSDDFLISVGSDYSNGEIDLSLEIWQDEVLMNTEIVSIPIGTSTLLFEDNAESGTDNWTASGNGIPWGINEDDSYDGAYSFGDSDNGNSSNYTSNFFTLNNSFDLTATSKPVLEFFAKWSLEGNDFTNLEISTDNGIGWQTLFTFTDAESWHQETFDLSPYKFGSEFKLRFRLDTDGDIPGDGFYFDKMSLTDYQCSLVGLSCNDGEMCTENDVYDDNCNCFGIVVDSDLDGVCDFEDLCAGLDDGMIGLSCDDGVVCTENDVFDEDCNCFGIETDSDADGICDAEDVCPVLANNLIGMPCNDGDALTIGEFWDEECACTGGIISSVPLLNSISPQLELYPNPVNDILQIKIKDAVIANSGSLIIEIYDPAAKKVMSKSFSISEEHLLDIGFLIPSIYFIKIQLGNKLFLSRFVVVK